MNVNPFSYLMNKISQKVSKSGDTMSGALYIVTGSGNAKLELGNETNSRGIIKMYSNNNKYSVLRSAVSMSDNRNIYLPDNDGTVALTQDFTPTVGKTSDGYIDWSRSGNVAEIRIVNGNFSNTGAGTSFYSLPSNLLPTIGVDQRDSYSNKRIKIETDGTIVCTESISNTIIRGSFTYICQ